jgi:hypothetical protein
MVYYKLWLEIERIDETNDSYDSPYEPLELGTYDSEREARRAALRIHRQNYPECRGPECQHRFATKQCPACNGMGVVEVKEEGCTIERLCKNCEGDGRIDADGPDFI